MVERFDVAILGAGIFGAALAFHLGQDPTCRVLLWDPPSDPRRPDGTATSGGVLSRQGWGPWDLAVVRETADEYERLAEQEGAPSPRRNGGVRVARTEDGERWLHRVERTLVREGVEARWVGAAEAGAMLPFADLSDVRGGLFTPDDAVVSASDLRDAYLRAAVRAGVDRRRSDPPSIRRSSEGRGWVLNDGATTTRSDSVALACGAASKRMAAALGGPVPLAPFRAQAVRLRPGPLLPEFPTLHDLDLNLYVRPDARGRILAGDGTGAREEDPEAWVPTADDEFVGRMRTGLSELFPGIRGAAVESAWAGLCVASPDRYPVVGPAPGPPGLFVASGFNGFGTMRAGGLARRLALAMRTDSWDELVPADPRRFGGRTTDFDPRPEFPLEAEDEGPPAPARDGPSDGRASFRGPGPVPEFRCLARPEDVDVLRWAPLSEWFDPFLAIFARDALRTGGTAEVAEEDGVVRGLALFGSSEGVGSGFTRERRVAERYLGRTDAGGIYLEAPWQAGGEPIELFAADLRDWMPSSPLRNPVRIATPRDLPGIGALLRSELGRGVDRWLATLPRPEETAFVCEHAGTVVGVSWLTRNGPHARGHSFAVHPRYRGLGIGTDLLQARMLWLQRTGGRSVVSEIYDGNAASRTAAERAGMAFVGRMYHFRPAPGSATSGAPRTSDTRSPSNPSTSRSTGTGP